MFKRSTAAMATGALAASTLCASVIAGAATAGGVSTAAAGILPMVRYVGTSFASKPPTTAQCLDSTGFACYSPGQFQTAYNMKPLYKGKWTGKGETIALVDSFGSPTIQKDLKTFDAGFGLPAPPSFKIIQPAGKVPPFNPKNSTMVDWAVETSLDVEYAHALAPGASLLLVETPVAETIGVHGFPQIVAAENYVIKHKMADVISQSLAAAEASFPSKGSILKLRSAYIAAAKAHVTAVAGAGDWGETSPSDASESTYYTHATANWPASDPLVTSVGGLQLHLNAAGDNVAAPNVWNENTQLGAPVAAGGGLSSVFKRPSYQNGVKGVVGSWRGLPDLSMSASVNGGALVYWSFKGSTPAYYIVGGTSEATPELAGVIAVADQYAGHPLGLINPALYKIAATKGQTGIVDVTTGENTVTWVQHGHTYTVQGAVAGPGYDLSSGLGTVNGASFVPELAKADK
jgi:subtilase family serine protease